MNESSPVSLREEDEVRAARFDHDRIAQTALLLVAAVFCALTWRKWGMLTIDCGHEMYVPAALSKGKRLYFDVWYAYGPLIPYFHALLFRMLGVHLWILEIAGIGIVGITMLATYALGRIFLPVALSFVAAFALIVQAFQLHLFNYVQPYAYPAAYGAMMIVVLVFLLTKDFFDERPWTMFAAGSIAGLEAITKIEFGLAAYIVIGVALFIRGLRSRSPARLLKDAVACIPGLLLCIGVYAWYIEASSLHFIFAENMPLLPSSYFVKLVGGLRARSLGFTISPVEIMQWGVVGLLGVVTIAAAVRLASASRIGRWLLAAGALLVCAFHLLLNYAERRLQWNTPELLNYVAPFFFFNRGMVVIAAGLAVPVLLKWRKGGYDRAASALLLLAAGSLAVGFRTLVGIQPTGFPIFYDTMAFIVFLIAVRHVARSFFHVPDSGNVWTSTSALLCCGLIALTAVYYPIHRRPVLISSPTGGMYAEQWTGQAFAETLTFLNEAKTRSEKFVVWPEESTLYFFTDTVAPTRWYQVTPGILPPGEATARYLEDLDRQQVRYVALSNRAAPEYGLPVFGADYNQDLYRWLQQNFHVVRTFGDYQRIAEPPHWAVQIWERKPLAQ